MPSAIDISKPVFGNPTTQSVRDNFSHAHDEITDLQNKTTGAPFLPISGGIMNGAITMQTDPANPLEVATKRYVDDLAFGTSGGIPDALNDGMAYARMGVAGGMSWVKNPLFQSIHIGLDSTHDYFHVGNDATYNQLYADSNNNFLRLNRTTNNFEVVVNNVVVQSWSATGPTFTNPSIVGSSPTLHLNAGGLADEYIYFENGANKRWAIGSDAAANNFGIFQYDSSGNVIDNPFSILSSGNKNMIFRRNPIVRPSDVSVWPGISIDGPTGTNKQFIGTVSGVNRWILALGNQTSESGSNAGSDFQLARYADNGTFIDNPLFIRRSDGIPQFGNTVWINAPTGVGAALVLNSTSAGVENDLIGRRNGLMRWALILGSNAAESGSNAGSDWAMNRYTDAGSYIDTNWVINRASGIWTVYSDIMIRQGGGGQGKLGIFHNNGGFVSMTSPSYGAFMHIEQGTGNLVFGWTDSNGNPTDSRMWLYGTGGYRNSLYVGATILSLGWSSSVAGNFYCWSNGDNRFYGVAGSRYIWTPSGGNDIFYIDNTGGQSSVNIRGWNYNWLQLQQDGQLSMNQWWAAKSGGGAWADVSDVRGKEIESNYETGLKEIVQLKPIRFRLKDNIEIMPDYERPEILPDDWKEPLMIRPHEKLAPRIFIGMAAQDCEDIMPELIHRKRGKIDGIDDDNIRGMDITPMFYAFINAFKEVNERLTHLEGLVS